MSEATMRRYYAAYNAEDEEALAALLAPEVVLVSAMGEQAGRDAYLATYRYMIENFVDQMEPLSIAAEGDRTIVRIVDRLLARHAIPDFMGRAIAHGEELRLDLVGRYLVQDGVIHRIEIAPA